MKFTEEEFYGNIQNTVLPGGDLSPLNKEESESQNEKIGLTILLTMLKTMLVLVCSVFYVLSVMVCIAPNSAIKVFDFVGAKRASLSCYENIYEKEKTLANLYNVVQKSIQNKDYQKTSIYIKELQGKSDYVNFCIKVNDQVLKVTKKEYVAYVGDLDSYLVSQNIYAKYESNNKEAAKEIAVQDLKNSNIYSFGFSSFIDCLENDNSLTNLQIDEKILEVVNSEIDSVSVLNLIKQRRAFVDVLGSDGTLNDKILRVYTSLKIEKALVRIYSASGEQELKSEAQNNIQNLQNEYNNLIR